MQFARENIRVNALSPGPVNTPLLQELFAKDQERARRVLELVSVGKLDIRIGARYPLDQARKAHEDLEARRTTGKLLLTP